MMLKYLIFRQVQSNPVNTDSKGAIESVRVYGVSVLSGWIKRK